MSNESEPTRLLVPIHIDALLVGTKPPPDDIFQWTDLAPDFARLQNDFFFGAELNGEAGNPFSTAADLLEPGVHLHFRLPRALTHGNQTGAGDIAFPTIPNRWLVQRFGGIGPLSDSPLLSYRAWLIRSDGERDDATPGVTWPTFHETGPVVFKKIGACTELVDPLDEQDETADPKITAVGPGNPAFSAYYPACRGVLGFYDPMTDVPAGTRLSYLVTGWYSDPVDDPLTGFYSEWQGKQSPTEAAPNPAQTQLSALQEWAKARAWTGIDLTGDDPTVEADPAQTLPTRLLCHGLARGIVWEETTTNYWQPSSQGVALSQPTVFPINTQNHQQAYKLAVGNTPAEALAALLAPGALDQDLLSALQSDVLSQPVTVAELQVELHERRFASVHGGTRFLIRPEAEAPDRKQIAPAPKPAGARPLPAELQKCLDELNARQQLCDERWRRVEDCRWLIYALWYLWTNECKADAYSPSAEAAKGKLAIAKAALTAERLLWESARDERDILYTAPQTPDGPVSGQVIEELAKHLKSQADGTPVLDDAGQPAWAYRLSTSTAAPFQTPNEPGIALSGPALTRHNSWQAEGALVCRVSSQTVTAINLQIPAGAKQTVSGERLGGALFPGWTDVPVRDGMHRTLLCEALLLDETNAAAIAGLLSAQYQNELAQTVRLLQNPRSTAAQSQPAQPPNRLLGRLPDPAATFDWQGNPWVPLYLVWEVGWQSDYPSPGREAAAQPLAADAVTSRWQLRKSAGGGLGGDLVPTRGEQPFASEQTFSGHTLLTPSASRNLAERLAGLNSAHPLINILKNLSVQSQTLGGFNDALTLQKPGLQLPPLDFEAWFAGGDFQIDSIHGELNDGFGPAQRRDTFRTAPQLADGPLLPIRAGRMQISQLSLVDAFGQTLKLPVNQINDSAKKNVPKDAQEDAQKAWMESLLRRAHSCVAESSVSAGDGSVVSLRPRFARPMRLRFEWANGSVLGGQKRGPVCGWVLPNHLEKSLAIYAATGKPLGALQRKLGIQSGSRVQGFYWVDVPGGATDGEDLQAQPLGERLAALIDDVHLRYFCHWALALGADDSAAFVGLIDRSVASADQRVPDEDPGVSVLVGRPLALVRADLRFEIAGLPAFRPRLPTDAALDTAEQKGADAIVDSADYQQVQWPLRLGDSHARNDGLIGAFRCTAAGGEGVSSGVSGGVSSGAFYPAWGQDEADEVSDRPGVFAAQDFTIDCLAPLAVTLLMDPQARVHATSGVLPRTFAELPHEMVTGARRAREVFFQTAPVLGLSPTPQMPKPSDDYGEWSWAYRPNVTHWHLDPAIVEATDRGAFAVTWPTIAEGWLKLAIAPVKVLSFWVREGAETVPSGARVHLAWSLQGAESLRLEAVTGDGPPVPLGEWSAAPFPREFGVNVQADTTYRITASAADADPSVKEITIRLAEPKPPAS